ncbi:MAG: hypothetical protein K1X82_06275 [Bacteroidia bacterium]|nr:hypothetical protein [Bacteroidia bacterium]
MKRIFGVIIWLLSQTLFSNAQELFTHVDPASNIPKGVLGVRVCNEFFKEYSQFRSSQVYRFMFGLSSKWMISQSFSFSNHHGKTLPAGTILTDSTGKYYTYGVIKGKKYPYGFDNFQLAIRYRFLSLDADHEHWRMTAILEFAGGTEPHDEAEPNIGMGDNGGLNLGITSTYLKNRFAISLNTAFTLPASYNEAFEHITIRYGKALSYNLALGYLVFPRVYRSYKQTNLNVYLELLGKTYGSGSIWKENELVSILNTTRFNGHTLLEARPSVQFIIHSNTRLDLSCGFPIVGTSYARFYPAYYFNIQHYFFFKSK